jgi:prolipoprotein diacylglyceryl transferase
MFGFVNEIDPILFEIGPLTIRYYGVFFASAILSGYLWIRNQFERCGADVEEAEKIFLTLFLCVVLGARLGHCLFYEPERYLSDPISILWIHEGGLASHGAAIALVIGLGISARRLRLSYLVLTDRVAGGIAFGSSFVRIGNFFNSEIVGRATDLPWAVVFPRYDLVARHPSQIYEVAMGWFTGLVLLLVDRRFGIRQRPTGLPSFLFLALYFSFRFGVEFFKEYQEAVPDGFPLTMGQILSIPFAMAGWIGLGVIWARSRRAARSQEGSG